MTTALPAWIQMRSWILTTPHSNVVESLNTMQFLWKLWQFESSDNMVTLSSIDWCDDFRMQKLKCSIWQCDAFRMQKNEVLNFTHSKASLVISSDTISKMTYHCRGHCPQGLLKKASLVVSGHGAGCLKNSLNASTKLTVVVTDLCHILNLNMEVSCLC